MPIAIFFYSNHCLTTADECGLIRNNTAIANSIITEELIQNSNGKAIENLAKISAYVLLPQALLAFANLLRNMDPSYRKTFIDKMRAKDLVALNFTNAKDDEQRASAALSTSRNLTSLIDSEIRMWVEGNWKQWIQEKPDWFDDRNRGRVPIGFIPSAKERIIETKRRSFLKVSTTASSRSSRQNESRKSNFQQPQKLSTKFDIQNKKKVQPVIKPAVKWSDP
mmetsp:Transcript_8629/g.17510  ORF Transcript_8629/g.17510 Transcript_8629/m.17510 type:complete len:223 (-) Transcript_8629:50-718(-)